jgi:hypothetical protein
MLNIELHGYGSEIDTVRAKVREAVASSPEVDEIITSVCNTDPQDQQGEKTPYLRVVASINDQRNLNDVLRRLKPLKEGIELVYLGKWIPKKK